MCLLLIFPQIIEIAKENVGVSDGVNAQTIEKPPVEILQLERQNERLKEALIK